MDGIASKKLSISQNRQPIALHLSRGEVRIQGLPYSYLRVPLIGRDQFWRSILLPLFQNLAVPAVTSLDCGEEDAASALDALGKQKLWAQLMRAAVSCRTSFPGIQARPSLARRRVHMLSKNAQVFCRSVTKRDRVLADVSLLSPAAPVFAHFLRRGGVRRPLALCFLGLVSKGDLR